MPRVWICGDNLALGTSVSGNLRHQLARQEPFAVVFENDRVEAGKIFANRCDDFCNLPRRRCSKFLAIDTDHLLMARDDTGFHDGVKRLLFNGVGAVDMLTCQQFPELLGTWIFADETHPEGV